MKKKHKGCLFPGCKREVKTRGLCNSHSVTAWNLIHRGKVTEAELVAKGRMLPTQFRVGKWFLTGEEGASS